MDDQDKRAKILGEVLVLSGRAREWQGLVAMATAGFHQLMDERKKHGLSEDNLDHAAWVVGPLLHDITAEVDKALGLSDERGGECV